MSDVTEHRLNALEHAVGEINASIKSIDQSMQVMARVEVNQQHMMESQRALLKRQDRQGEAIDRLMERNATQDERMVTHGRIIWAAVAAGISGLIGAIIQAL